MDLAETACYGWPREGVRLTRGIGVAVVLGAVLAVAPTAQGATIRGTAESDRLGGTDGADRIYAGSGNDRVDGRRGHDRLNGGKGRDVLKGGLGGDRLNGHRGNDRLSGGPGDDILRDSHGSDRFIGGQGDDKIHSRDGGVDRVYCGAGTDIVIADPEDLVSASCEGRSASQPEDESNTAQPTGGWIVCSESATGTVTPGLTMVPQPVTMLNSDVITDCMSSDATIESGTGVIRGTSVAATCAGGPLDGMADITWNTGQTTRLTYSGAFGGAVATARGAVVDGTAFVGQHFFAFDTLRLDPSAPEACSSAEGLTSVGIDGHIFIGLPFVDLGG